MTALQDKHVVLTGGGAGIGLGILKACVAAGAEVTVFEKNLDTRNVIQAAGGTFVQVDVSSADALETACDCIDTCHGIVSNAGITIQKPLTDLTVAEMDLLWQVNQRPALLLPKLLAAKMPSGASIVNIASNHAGASDVGYEAYAGTKGALVAMSKALAWSLGRQGIRVNTLSPGLTMTEAVQAVANTGPDDASRFASWHATNRVNSVDDIGQAAVFLLSDASRAITGADLVADQGMSARLGDIK